MSLMGAFEHTSPPRNLKMMVFWTTHWKTLSSEGVLPRKNNKSLSAVCWARFLKILKELLKTALEKKNVFNSNPPMSNPTSISFEVCTVWQLQHRLCSSVKNENHWVRWTKNVKGVVFGKFAMTKKYEGNSTIVPSRELTYPLLKALLKMIFFFARWDIIVPRRVFHNCFCSEKDWGARRKTTPVTQGL